MKGAGDVALLSDDAGHHGKGSGLALNVADFFQEFEGIVPELKGVGDVALLSDDAGYAVEGSSLALRIFQSSVNG